MIFEINQKMKMTNSISSVICAKFSLNSFKYFYSSGKSIYYDQGHKNQAPKSSITFFHGISYPTQANHQCDEMRIDHSWAKKLIINLIYNLIFSKILTCIFMKFNFFFRQRVIAMLTYIENGAISGNKQSLIFLHGLGDSGHGW